METIHLSEDPESEYEQIHQPAPEIKKKSESKSWKIGCIVFCVSLSISIFVVIVVELVNAIKGNPYL